MKYKPNEGSLFLIGKLQNGYSPEGHRQGRSQGMSIPYLIRIGFASITSWLSFKTIHINPLV